MIHEKSVKNISAASAEAARYSGATARRAATITTAIASVNRVEGWLSACSLFTAYKLKNDKQDKIKSYSRCDEQGTFWPYRL